MVIRYVKCSDLILIYLVDISLFEPRNALFFSP